MSEPPNLSPRDLLLAHKWSSLLFTTYSLSLSFLEAAAVSAVAGSYRDLAVLTDLEGYRASLADAGAVGVGRSYDVVPIEVRGGVFHPKIGVVADDEGTVRATVGSGNLTFGGWGYNTELFEALVPGADSACFADLAGFFEALAESVCEKTRIAAERIPDLGPFIDACRRAARVPGESASRVLHTISGPLDVQIAGIAAELGGAVSLITVSPFFSAHHGVRRLAASLSCELVSVAVPPRAPEIFDFDACSEAGFPVAPVACDLFADTRSLHAKLFDIECRRGRLLVTGSANATVPALSGRNVEAVVARIVDRARSLGWRPSGTHQGEATGERPPEEAAGPCIVAHFDGRTIAGRIFGAARPQGPWQAFVSSGTRREAAGIVEADADGRFRFEPPASMDPIALPTSAQVVLERDGLGLRGWIVLQELLLAIREKGPVARSFGRVLSGSSTSADIGAILEYLVRTPGAALNAADRRHGSRENRAERAPYSGAAIPSSDLQPISAFDMHSTWRGAGISRGFDSLFDALLRHFATSLPDVDDDAGDDEDDDASAPKAEGRKSAAPAKRGQRVPVALAKKSFESMFAMLERRAPGPDRIPGLYALFDMILQIAPRCDDGDELTLSCHSRWLAAANGCRPPGGEAFALDRCVVCILGKRTMDDPKQAVASHAALQRWIGSELSETMRRALAPDAEALDERRIAPGATQAAWSGAWQDIIATITPWAGAKALEAAVRTGSVLDFPDEVTKEERDLLRAVAQGKAKSDRVVTRTVSRPGKPSCPHCNYVLPAVQRGRLQRIRVATCDNLRCRRVIIDISH